MAWSFSVGNTPATGADTWFILITNLIAAGWSCVQFSNGSSVASGAPGTSASIKPQFSWFRMQSPADPNTSQVREFVIQSNGPQSGPNGFYAWAGKYSPRAGFTTSGLTAADAPEASDEVTIVMGVGHILGNSSHTTGSWSYVLDTDGSYRFHTAAGDSSTNYSWWWLTLPSGGSTTGAAMLMDVPNPWNAQDTDPACWYFQAANSTACYGNGQFRGLSSNVWSIGGPATNPRGSFANKFSSAVAVISPYSSSFNGLPVNAWSGNDPVTPYLYFMGYGNTSFGDVHPGAKGFSKWLLCDMCSAARTNMDTVTIATSQDHIYVNGTLLPWNGTTPVL